MSSLEDYLGSAQAWEDVRALLDDSPRRKRSDGSVKPEGQSSLTIDRDGFWTLEALDAWTQVLLVSRRVDNLGWKTVANVYYRPDSDRFIVSDLGEGVKALRLRTGQRDIDLDIIDRIVRGVDGPILLTEQVTRSTCDKMDLAECICRVLLASHRVANLGAERSGE